MKRVSKIIRLKPEYRDQYEEYHKNIWPEIAGNLKKCNIRNYSISCIDDLLFSYFEYTGDCYEEDMSLLASFPQNQKWREIMKKMQYPYNDRLAETAWEELEEVFYME